MLTEKEIIWEYEEVLMGRQSNFKISMNSTNEINKKEAGIIWRYAVSKFLKWSPNDALTYMTPKLVKVLRLELTLPAFGFNDGRAFLPNYTEMLAAAFPDEINYDFTTSTITEYKEFTDENTTSRRPKNFFFDERGKRRAKIVMRYLVHTYLGGMSNEELYLFFQKRSAVTWLKEKWIGDLLTRHVFASPLELFHASLPYEERDMFLYWSAILRSRFDKEEHEPLNATRRARDAARRAERKEAKNENQSEE